MLILLALLFVSLLRIFLLSCCLCIRCPPFPVRFFFFFPSHSLASQERAIENEPLQLGLPRLIAIRGEARPRAVLVRCHVSSLSLSGHFLLETADRFFFVFFYIFSSHSFFLFSSLFHFKGPKADVGKLKYAVRAIAALRKERLKKIKGRSLFVLQLFFF